MPKEKRETCDVLLPIPSEKDFEVKVGQTVCIQVDRTCTWSYNDPTPCFPDGLLKPGTYTATHPPTRYGPYLAVNAGKVTFKADGKTLTAHSIVVS